MSVDEYLLGLVSRLELNNEDKAQFNTSFGYLKSKLYAYFQDNLESVEIIGSFDRGTMLTTAVNSEPDIDVLIIFKKDQFKPQTYLSQIKRFAEMNYSKSEIFQSHPTIAIAMSHVRFELIPGYKETGIFTSTLKIPAPKSLDITWIETAPADFKNKLNDKNRRNDSMIFAIILLLKYWNTLNNKLFDSYFFEQFCLDRSYSGCDTISAYFYEIIDGLNYSRSNFNEANSKLISELFERRRRLKVLENSRMSDYIETEFSQFLPMI